MMLRSKSGSLTVWVENKADGERKRYNYSELLGTKQQGSVATKPDIMWQLAQKIKAIEEKKGRDVAVYMEASVRVNGGYYHPFTDPKVDLASEEWHPFKHSKWILPSPNDYSEKPVKE